MFDEKLKELEDKRKRIKKEKLEKKKRAERRKRREEKKKLDEKKALEKRKKLQARRQAIEEEKLAKQREIEKAEELARKEKEKKEKLEEKRKRKEQKETEKFLRERQKKHQKYLEIKERMEKEKRELFEKEIPKDSEIADAVNVVKKQEKGKRVKKEKSKINFLGIVFLLVCITVLAYSSYQIYIWVKSTKDLATIEEEVIEKVVKEVKDTSKEYSINIDFEELLKINSDIVGWIYIANTDVNYPIMQANNNDYYLKKNIYKEYSSCGSIFLDCNTDKFNEDNTVIYGHNLKNQKMFADLKKKGFGNILSTERNRFLQSDTEQTVQWKNLPSKYKKRHGNTKSALIPIPEMLKNTSKRPVFTRENSFRK